MVDYASLAATADRLISANGRSATIRKLDRAPANAAAPWDGGGLSHTDVAVTAVVYPFEAKDVDGQVVRREDRQALVSAVAAGANDVEDFDLLVDGVEEFKIVRADVIAPGNTRIVYMLHLRK